MHFIIVVIVSLFKSVAAYNDTIYLPDVPEDALEGYLQCKGNATQGLSGDMIWQGYLACLDAYFNNLGPNDLTDEEWSFFKNSRLGLDPPPTGKRTRREVRTLSDNEWNAVVVVWLTMYKDGTLRKFGRLHGQAATWAHMGAAFLVWHRVFITHFEEEMRKINPNVSLPYWDNTIDYKLTEPADSVVWTHCFFGQNDNESQIIKDGPFKDFYGAHGAYLSRAPGSSCRDRLINDKDVETVKNNCHYKDITLGSNNSNEPRILEVLHNHVHLWVGGDMSVFETAAFDPVFFVHHAFIDYIFEQFRKTKMNAAMSSLEKTILTTTVLNAPTEIRMVTIRMTPCLLTAISKILMVFRLIGQPIILITSLSHHVRTIAMESICIVATIIFV